MGYEGEQNDEPQGIPTIKFRHLPTTGWLRVLEGDVTRTYLLYISHSQNCRLEDMSNGEWGGWGVVGGTRKWSGSGSCPTVNERTPVEIPFFGRCGGICPLISGWFGALDIKGKFVGLPYGAVGKEPGSG